MTSFVQKFLAKRRGRKNRTGKILFFMCFARIVVNNSQTTAPHLQCSHSSNMAAFLLKRSLTNF